MERLVNVIFKIEGPLVTESINSVFLVNEFHLTENRLNGVEIWLSWNIINGKDVPFLHVFLYGFHFVNRQLVHV